MAGAPWVTVAGATLVVAGSLSWQVWQHGAGLLLVGGLLLGLVILAAVAVRLAS